VQVKRRIACRCGSGAVGIEQDQAAIRARLEGRHRSGIRKSGKGRPGGPAITCPIGEWAA